MSAAVIAKQLAGDGVAVPVPSMGDVADGCLCPSPLPFAAFDIVGFDNRHGLACCPPPLFCFPFKEPFFNGLHEFGKLGGLAGEVGFGAFVSGLQNLFETLFGHPFLHAQGVGGKDFNVSHVKGDTDEQPGHAGGHGAVGFGNGLVDELRQGGGLLLVEFLAQDVLQEAADGLGHA